MKKLQLFTLLLVILCACSKEDDTATVLNGSWKLERIEDGFIENSPNDEEITISFENDVYTGRTEANEFGGDYTVARDSLFLSNSYTTEVTETEWGQKFYESLRMAFDEREERSKFRMVIEGSILTLRNGSKNLIFEATD
ncbi:lipocalin-like domain-containing protein [Salinimicrobium sp. GXAS 041]|uniref:lipocalin-like domain-containing protein n=1 Tax=Salinimicrobium sp. GXAS 041 TaxID=3400806 RepID=UPI003C70B555